MADGTGNAAVEFASGSFDELTLHTELWRKSSVQLESALYHYDRLNSESLPETAWFGRPSRQKCQKEIDATIDAALRLLGTCGAVENRDQIRALQQNIADAHQFIGEYREMMLTAPSQDSLAFPNSVWTKSSESYQQAITEQGRSVDEMRLQIGRIKEQFRSQLQEMGMDVKEGEVDSLLMPVTQDDIVSMSAIVNNIAILTAQLERLTEESSEVPSHTRKYYGIYLLLVYSIGRVQTRFIQEIDGSHVPRLHQFQREAEQNIVEAQRQIARGGPKDQLKANIDASRTTIEACQCFAEALRDQRNAIACENEHTKRMYAAAVNTYRTVQLSLNVVELMSNCQKAFQALRQLQVPRLRPFQNLQLREEMNRLAERMILREV